MVRHEQPLAVGAPGQLGIPTHSGINLVPLPGRQLVHLHLDGIEGHLGCPNHGRQSLSVGAQLHARRAESPDVEGDREVRMGPGRLGGRRRGDVGDGRGLRGRGKGQQDADRERDDTELEVVHWRLPPIPVVANLTAEPYSDPETIAVVLERQLSSPVRWGDGVRKLLELGCESFLEVGPKRALTGMMRELAPGARPQVRHGS